MNQGKYHHQPEGAVGQLSAAAIQTLLLLPCGRIWLYPTGRSARAISDLLDDGTALIEEAIEESGDEFVWRVRLTEAGLKVVLQL